MERKIMNTIKFTLQILLFISSSSFNTHIAESKSTANFPLAKPGCNDTCGNVTIPFPFGIGSGCFLDEWYEVVCDANTTLPRLKKVGVEVLNISLTAPTDLVIYAQGQITVNLPITYDSTSNCSTASGSLNGSQVSELTDFTGSNFYYSEENLFLSVGCNNSAFLLNITDASVGCQTKCRAGGPESRFYGTCLTGNCCQDKIRSVFFQALNYNFQKDGGVAAESCSYAFLADQSWLKTNVTELEMVRTVGHAPALLDWGVSNLSKIGIDFGVTSRDSAYGCDADNGVFTRCYCRYGFRGNAYLADGCQDINECEDKTDTCGEGTKCVNKRGGFSCVDRNRTIKLVSISVGPVIVAFLLLLLGRWLYKDMKRRQKLKQKQNFFKKNGGLLLQQQLSSPESNVERGKLFDSKELKKATDNFNKDRILGQGGQGTVYKGMLTDGRIVAIKKSIMLDEGNVEQFINEVFILSQINHRNIVKLLGCCLETDVPLLVYEFIPNGTLHQYLHSAKEEFAVPWNVRLRLATEVAGALAYLHSAAAKPIYHRDIKTANILLDEKYQAKIADFGTSRIVSIDETHVTTLIRGTLGYLDPEYFQSSQFTDKSDVYSFGVVLVELLTGQKPVSALLTTQGRSLVTHFIMTVEEKSIFEVLDTQLLDQGKKEEIEAVADIAKRCLHLNGRSRPSMKEVALELEGVLRSSQQQHSDVRNYQSKEDTEKIGVEGHDAALRSRRIDGSFLCHSDDTKSSIFIRKQAK